MWCRLLWPKVLAPKDASGEKVHAPSFIGFFFLFSIFSFTHSLSLSVSLTNTLLHYLTHSWFFSHSVSPSHSPMLFLNLFCFSSLTHFRSLSLFFSGCFSIYFAHNHPCSLSLTPSFFLSLSLFLSHYLSVSLSISFAQAHTHSLFLSHSLCFPIIEQTWCYIKMPGTAFPPIKDCFFRFYFDRPTSNDTSFFRHFLPQHSNGKEGAVAEWAKALLC